MGWVYIGPILSKSNQITPTWILNTRLSNLNKATPTLTRKTKLSNLNKETTKKIFLK